jgi:hypothetical protein
MKQERKKKKNQNNEKQKESKNMQVSDDEVKALVWASSVPLLFSLAANEVTTFQSPEPFFGSVFVFFFFYVCSIL